MRFEETITQTRDTKFSRRRQMFLVIYMVHSVHIGVLKCALQQSGVKQI